MIENSLNEKVLQERKLKDFDMLSDLLSGKVKIQDLDYALKVRLIKLCQERKEQLDEKIRRKKYETAILENFLNKIKK